MIRAASIIIFVLLSLNVKGQYIDFQLILADKVSNTPVSDAHIFVSNSSFGAISKADGSFTLAIPSSVKDDLIISHISYDTEVVRYGFLLKASDGDTIYLQPNGINIDEIVVKQKRSKAWKKNLKKFTEAFIGSGRSADKCKILNPEVLRFSTVDDVFMTTAIDMLSIENKHLGYNVEFLLEKLTIDANGSMKYIGHANFKDISTPDSNKKIKKNRSEAYRKSPKHFFEHLIHDDLENGKYKIRSVRYDNGNFEEIGQPNTQDIIYYDSTTQHYFLTFDEFLEIKHLGFKVVEDINMGVRQGGLESSRFNSTQQGASSKISYPTSYLYKLMPSLIINKHGNVVNHKAVQEYGYWATQRMSQKLPLDYGNSYTNERVERTIKSKNSSKDTTPEVAKLQAQKKTSLDLIKDLIYGDDALRTKTFAYIDKNWNDLLVPPLLDLMRINQNPNIHTELTALIQQKTGAGNYYEGLQWMWQQEAIYDSIYGSVKAEIYQHIDPKFKTYFAGRDQSAKIGLDEIVWGGVLQDGIPPLRYPQMIDANDSRYLHEDDMVFGISIEGQHRAYPKRILAWHEFFVDTIGGKTIAGVYCTLCGTMIAYDMNHQGTFHDLGTSGFLYMSNKLMYDGATQSLWSTIEGSPVLGPLAGKNIRLDSYPTVTTTWGEWRRAHPDTRVLSLETGHLRNYDEGEAYKSYFADDNLMFPVPRMDDRLKNKDEVLVVRAPEYKDDPAAISIQYLRKKQIFQDRIGDNPFVVIAEKDGWARAYASSNVNFKSYKKGILKDANGHMWSVEEERLIGPKGQTLSRIPSHNIFWFAWFNAYPNTRLVK